MTNRNVSFVLCLAFSCFFTQTVVSQTAGVNITSVMAFRTGKELSFLNDKRNQVLVIDPDKGHLKIFNSKGEMVREKYFSDQNPDHWPEMFKEVAGCDVIGGFCEPWEEKYNKGYIAIFRHQGCGMPQVSKHKYFKNELTLLSSSGETLFQNRVPDSITGMPLKMFENLHVIVVGEGPVGAESTSGQYYGLDFQGKKIWEYHGGLIFDPGDLNVGGKKKGFLKLAKREIHSFSEGVNLKPGDAIPIGEMIRDVDTGQELNLKTGEVTLVH